MTKETLKMILLNRKDIEGAIKNVITVALESLDPELKQELLQDLIELIEQIQDEIE